MRSTACTDKNVNECCRCWLADNTGQKHLDIMASRSDDGIVSEADDSVDLLDVLKPDTLRKVFLLLSDTPKSIVALSLTCSQALSICSSESLWKSLCNTIIHTCPPQLRECDWSPTTWNASSYQDLYMNLLLPFKPLLQQRFWHSTKMTSGQLLVIDAQPPLIVARSVFYKDLERPPFSQLVFVVGLPGQKKVSASVRVSGSTHWCGLLQQQQHYTCCMSVVQPLSKVVDQLACLHACMHCSCIVPCMTGVAHMGPICSR